MAVVQICHEVCYKGFTISFLKESRQKKRRFICSNTASQEISWSFSSISNKTSRRQHVSYDATGVLMKINTRKCRDVSGLLMSNRGSVSFHTTIETSVLSSMQRCTINHLRFSPNNASQKKKMGRVWCALQSSSNEEQLRSLESYFGKLNNDANQHFSSSLDKRDELLDKSGDLFRAKKGLQSLDDYLGKLNEDVMPKNYRASASDGTTKAASYSIRGASGSGKLKKQRNYMDLKNKGAGEGPTRGSYNETSNLYLISILASINIAVFLFEIASPIKNSDQEVFSLPLLYGAKINHLILFGEWWRLVTPMFLHSGIFHVALGCWVLLSFGPQVCRTYGSFTFCLIYVLGGISGNLISFLHTPEATVGGTGPAFALIGAWFIYQIQNRNVTGKEDAEGMFQKAIMATAFSCILSNFGPIDDWTHFGAAFTGIVYGCLTCPTLQVDNASTKTRQEEGIVLVRQHADPCKSLIFFSLLILFLSSLLLVVEPPLNSLAADGFL